TRAVSEVIAFRDDPISLSTGTGTAAATGMLVSGNYFAGLSIDMILGSPITPDDDRPKSSGTRGLVAVLSEQCWSQRFNRDPDIIGQQVRIEKKPLTIIGIVPTRFRKTRVSALPDIFMPITFAPKIFHWANTLNGPANNWLRIIIRKQPDASF